MLSIAGTLAAPFPYFGGKANACETVWQAFGIVDNYVEPFAGSAAMLLGAPDGKRVETLNDADGFVANFWRAVSHDPEAVANAADWPTNEADLFARHSWLIRQRDGLLESLHADPEFYDAKIAGWWCWGACNWIGSGWCSGTGPWVHDGEKLVDNRQLPHLSAGRGINRQLPHLSAGRGINRKLPHLGDAGQGDQHPRSAYIHEWMSRLHTRLRAVRVTCGDWQRVVKDSVTTRHGLTGLFLDPPYAKGSMDYGAGGMGLGIAEDVRAWCKANGQNKALRLVLCGHAGEHDDLLQHGWQARKWTARKGYALTDEAVENSASETVWCSPHCMPEINVTMDLFA
jgi:site-specific DNA-adenine methylase